MQARGVVPALYLHFTFYSKGRAVSTWVLFLIWAPLLESKGRRLNKTKAGHNQTLSPVSGKVLLLPSPIL